MKKLRMFGVGIACVIGLVCLLRAQEAAEKDSIVQLTAEADGLSPVAPPDLPESATFWVVTAENGVTAPWPCPPRDAGCSFFVIAPGQYLADMTGGKIPTKESQAVEDALAGLAGSVGNLITWIQEAQVARSLARAMGREAELDAPMNFSSMMASFDTNSLYLEITNVSNGTVFANLHNATNQVYAILGATNLAIPFADWQVERELWPTNSDVMPFTVPTLGRNNLLLRALDLSGVDSDEDGTPDFWAWLYWGTNNVPAGLDFANGTTFAADYSNSITPTVFQFTGIEVTNNHVNSSSVVVQLDVAGSPYYVAISVDDTNYETDAIWNTYGSSNLTVNLGLTEGWHDVWVGLRGHADDVSSAVWQWHRLKLDWTPPALIITNPASGTVDVPLIQLQGYSSEVLSGISYDLSNAVGTATNQQALITGQTYSINTMEFTTNYFQCYDVPLTNGTNTITLHAMDLAGNVTALTTNIVYIANTNPPTVGLLWPADGMQMAGESVTIQGQVNDPTATVSVTVADADGNTNSFNGRAGRDGVFWIENVGLTSGTNSLAITLSTAAGNTTTNISLIQGGISLTVSPVAAGDALVSGTIGTNDYTVWVNGNQATNNGDGTWTAQITPLCVGGGLVAVTAIPDSDNGGNGNGGGDGVNPSSTLSLNTQVAVQPPQGTFIASYHKNYQSPYPFDATAFWTIFGNVFWDYDNLNWEDGSGGTEDTFYTSGFEITFPTYDNNVWPANNWPQSLPNGTWNHLHWNYDQYNETTTVVTNQSDTGVAGLAQEHCDMIGTMLYLNEPVRRTADTEVKLATGGPLGSKQMNLWCLTASATAYTNLYDTVGTNVPYEQIEIGSYGNLDTNGELWVMLPDNDPDVVTPHVGGKKKIIFSVGRAKYTLKHTTYYPAFADTNLSRTTVGVGEEVSFGFQPTMPYAMDWTTTTGSLSPTFSSSTTLTSPSNAVSGLTVTATLRGGKSVKFPPFNVVEPAGIDHAKITVTNHYSIGVAGVGMHMFAWIAPTSVSFYRINVMEVGEDATNMTGYFAQWTPQQLHHSTADHWSRLNSENQFQDEASDSSEPSPWSAGSYTWDIPARWQVAGSDVTNSMSGWNQTASIDAAGTMTVQKFGHSVTRTTNDVITTQ